MLSKKAIIPETPAPKTLTYHEIVRKEGVYREVSRDYPHRIVTLMNSDGSVTTLYCSGTVVQPITSGFTSQSFIAIHDEEVTITFTKFQ